MPSNSENVNNCVVFGSRVTTTSLYFLVDDCLLFTGKIKGKNHKHRHKIS